MKYYLLSHSADKKETGDFHQAVYPSGRKYYESPLSLLREDLTNEYFLEIEPLLDFELTKKAKLTDIVSAANISERGLLMNEKTKAIFEQFNIINHKFYPSTVTTKGKELPYYWLHIVNNSFEGIDFEKSEFMEADLFQEKVKTVKIISFEDYFIQCQKCENLNSIIAEEVVFSKEFEKTQNDIFFSHIFIGI